MRTQKKNSPENLETEEIEKEKNFYDLLDKAEQGDTKSIIRMLAEFRYEMSKEDLNEFLGSH